MTKTCAVCNVVKPIENFPPYKGKPHALNKCRPCKQSYDRLYHSNRSSESRAIKLAAIKARDIQLKTNLWQYKSTHPCIDCGETDPIVLEFDHRDPALKENNVTSLLAAGRSWKSILKEINKCDVRCANCHRRKTHAQFGWFSL